MSQENKPCPFCGSKHLYVIGMASEQDDDGDYERILCSTCGALGPNAIKSEEAREKWNKRDYTVEDRLHSAIESLNQKLFTERYNNNETIKEKDAIINWLTEILLFKCSEPKLCEICFTYLFKTNNLNKCKKERK